MSTARTLAGELGADVPPGVAALPDEAQDRLATLIHQARVRQADALEGAVQEGLGFVPRVLRGTITRIVLR
ncbi:hypothetical protein [Nocardioides sp. R-C-SC26]|uniref:hypothetical protein n=1 Tax=Nocardioides sp. R-C-SC26 TaxID=2870414 RepID=UPI001E5DD52F|nr:hypothetical protein [Nocardioides sp. R-C-SC26]